MNESNLTTIFGPKPNTTTFGWLIHRTSYDRALLRLNLTIAFEMSCEY